MDPDEVSIISDEFNTRDNKFCELKFGDTICLSRTVLHTKPTHDSEETMKMYLAAEGLAQRNVYAVGCVDWWLHSNECLFRIESYQPILDFKAHQSLEDLALSTAFKKCRGQRVHFGQPIQLRHILSGKLLSLELKHKASGKITVSNHSAKYEVSFLPCLNIRQQGEGITYNDGLALAFEVDDMLYYLSSTTTNKVWDVGIVNRPSMWRAQLIRDYSVPREVLGIGTPFMIKKK